MGILSSFVTGFSSYLLLTFTVIMHMKLIRYWEFLGNCDNVWIDSRKYVQQNTEILNFVYCDNVCDWEVSCELLW